MSIFVTGGTGFLGSYLLRHLLSEGHTNITALRRSTSNMDLIADIAQRIQWIEGDLDDPFCLAEGMAGKKWVFHIAAMVSFQQRDRYKMREVNADGTANVVNACLDLGVQKLIHVSSIAAVGRTKPNQVLNEKNIFQTSPYNTEYGISKFLGEQEVWRGIAEGLNAAIVNPSVIIGAGRWHEGTGQFFATLHKGFRFVPTGKISLVDVRDVARMLLQIAQSDISDERFIANAGELTYRDFFGAIAQEFQVKKPNWTITPLLREIAWRLASLQSMFTGKPPVVTKENFRQAALEYHFENNKSIQHLDFQYTPIEQTIAETSRVFLQSGGKTRVFE
ncbi:NAD-dependent epimerase/dehydratase family protein [Haliscomenobacter hydrossis]|uniref:NAD-dependent epimerase/dehydratase n=1 Tax=Haliscomenobacter hydrossis (strain ATCC 27775 / DSM 1100 / LMG 10767 / O) TaxID=760192 RepID=F4KU72_HALH1|nr:NAD-dependent epimerase/dehydratase family protein [Haliscomenobacter hydrossis]AEE50169.1 NAD-dependent epimerase/dehydratase [Haliscomenobacter hydrossis DSM 1100]